jgi:hypothetical protein
MSKIIACIVCGKRTTPAYHRQVEAKLDNRYKCSACYERTKNDKQKESEYRKCDDCEKEFLVTDGFLVKDSKLICYPCCKEAIESELVPSGIEAKYSRLNIKLRELANMFRTSAKLASEHAAVTKDEFIQNCRAASSVTYTTAYELIEHHVNQVESSEID